MLTQQDLLDRLNQLTIHYNLTWRDIKYDADKAINKINDFMGTIYPPMSNILLHNTATYSYRTGGVDKPFISDEYIHKIVIPYIATEVLARDEEFTTIYNKYLMEIEDGLFNMFQKEFNRVPLAFRQSADAGVFFATDGALQPVGREIDANLEVIQFRVYYHINNDNVVYQDEFFSDTTLYNYQASHTVLDMPAAFKTLFYNGYAEVALFQGWARNQSIPINVLAANDIVTVDSDIHLYAVWTTTSTLNITSNGVVTFNETYKTSIVDLVIPDKVNNVYVRTIPSLFTNGAVSLHSIILPATLSAVLDGAFYQCTAETITFIEPSSFDLTIGDSAFEDMSNLLRIVLPTNITSIGTAAFNTPYMKIYVRYLEANVPWVAGWFASGLNIEVEYGYNG